MTRIGGGLGLGLVLGIGMGLGVFPGALHAQATMGQPGTYVIRGGTVVPRAGERLENASVLIRDGRIAAVGANVQAPAGAIEIDARGKFVYPGMIDSHTTLGLTEIGSVAGTEDRTELGDFNPHVRALVAVTASNELLPVTRANGVTAAITAPAGGLISGQAALLHLDGWTWEDMAIRPVAALAIQYPRAGGGGGGFGGFTLSPEQERSAEQRVQRQVQELKDFLALARDYERARTGGSRAMDVKLEALRPLMRGEVPALITADTPEQIRGALALADEFGLKPIIRGGDQAYAVAAELARRRVPVILGGTMSTPPSDAPYDAIYANAGVLHRAGVRFAFSSGSAANSRHLPYHAALAIAYGLPAEAAWHALTSAPAEIWGVADRLGTIEVGKSADLFVTTGDPLDIRSQVQDVFIEGRRQSRDDRHTRLYELWSNRPRAPTQ